jgi:Dienelactone hydrolase family
MLIELGWTKGGALPRSDTTSKSVSRLSPRRLSRRLTTKASVRNEHLAFLNGHSKLTPQRRLLKEWTNPEIGRAMSVVTSALEDFEVTPFTSSTRRTRDVYRKGNGPAVIVIHEIPGITPLVAAFARKVADRGMTAVLPNLFGVAGKPMTFPYVLSSFARVCVSKEFTVLALNRTSPIVDYLRELAGHEHATCGGPGVGALGTCTP